MDRHAELGSAPIGKLLFKYSVPAIVSMVVNAFYNFVDRIFIGAIDGVGALAITGVGVSLPILLISVAFAVAIAVGSATNISLKLGEGNNAEAEGIMGSAATLSVLLGVILVAIYFIAGDSALIFFGATEASLPHAKAYTDMLMLGVPHWMLMFALCAIMRADGSPKKSAFALIAACFVNIPLDWLFIFKLNMGVMGAALATDLAELVGMLICVHHFASKKSGLAFRMPNLKPTLARAKRIFFVGLAPFTVNLSMSASGLVYNYSLKEYGGDLAIGALTALSSVLMVFIMIVFGIMQGMQPIVGYNYGAKHFDRAKRTYMLAVFGATAVMTVGFVIMQLFPEFCVSLFTKDPELMRLTVDGIHKYAITMPLAATILVGSNYMTAIGQFKIAMFLSLMRPMVVMIPALIILPNFFGLSGVWYANPLADVVAFAAVVTVLHMEFRRYKI